MAETHAGAGRDAKAASRRRPAIRSTGASPSSSTRTSLVQELERVFDICHGCRRCFSLCNSFPTAVRCDRRLADRRTRWRRQEGLLGGRRSLLPLRHVLHDEVSVRAAAPVEHRLPAPDAARQGRAVPQGRRRALRDRVLSATDTGRHASPAFRSSSQVVNAVNAAQLRPHACSRRRSACIPRRRFPSITATPAASASRAATSPALAVEADGRDAAARSRCSPPATATATSRTSTTTSPPCSSTTASR